MSKSDQFFLAGCAKRLAGTLRAMIHISIVSFGRRAPSGSITLKSRVFRAGGWALVAHVGSLALRLAATLITTRLFTPEIFGIFAIATSVNVVIALLSDIGLLQAVIRSPNGRNRSFLNTAWTLQILVGWWIWVICSIVAAGLYFANQWGWFTAGSVYSAASLPAIIMVTSFSSVIFGFQSMKAVTVNRDLNLKQLTMIGLIAQFAALSVTVAVGYLTRSIWSFVAGYLAVYTLTTLLSHAWLSGPRDRVAWDRDALRELAHFGKWTFLSSVFTAFGGNGDRLMLGAWFDSATMGSYSIASNLASTIDGAADRLFVGVTLPALSEVVRNQPDRLASLYSRIRWLTDTAFVGFAGFLYASAEWIIALLYDPRYAPAGPILQWLSFGLLFARYRLAQSAYLALGRPSYQTAINLAKLISLFVLVPGLYYAFGFQGAIVGIAFHLAPTALLVFSFNRRHGLNNVPLEIATLAMWPVGWVIGRTLIVFASV